ncbi:MAG TPA: hypothetical protein VH417_18580 [Vicinamibacterales bacterium]
MEVSRTRGPFSSLRDFVVEVATVVLGVIIALSFQGLREWNRDRTLANEARSTIVRELTDNHKAVDSDLQAGPRRKEQLAAAVTFADELIRTGKTAVQSLDLAINFGELSTAGWQTAEHTGALAHMSYVEVQKYAAAYALQDLYRAQQLRTLEDVGAALAILGHGDPVTAPREDLERLRTSLLTLTADLFIERQLGTQLSERFAKTLKD